MPEKWYSIQCDPIFNILLLTKESVKTTSQETFFMEQQLRLWLQQQFELSNDYASWAAITGVIVLILAIAVILHLTLHKGLLPYIERRTR